jgi:hypothetical protein
MSVHLKKVLVLLSLVACIAVLSMVFLNHSEKTGAHAAVLDGQSGATPVSSCANTACNGACWEEGTQHNQGTFAKRTIITPDWCNSPGGCVTQSCN